MSISPTNLYDDCTKKLDHFDNNAINQFYLKGSSFFEHSKDWLNWDLRIDSQSEKHEEEENGPNVGEGELVHRLREQDEGQARATCRLKQGKHNC